MSPGDAEDEDAGCGEGDAADDVMMRRAPPCRAAAEAADEDGDDEEEDDGAVGAAAAEAERTSLAVGAEEQEVAARHLQNVHNDISNHPVKAGSLPQRIRNK